MPPQPGFIPSSACLRHHLLPVLRRQQLRRQGIPEAAMPGQTAAPAVGGDPSPTLLPTAAVHTTAGRGPLSAAGPVAGLQGVAKGDLFVTPYPGADLAATAGTRRFRADAPTVIPGATVGREPFPTVAPTDDPPAALGASAGRDTLPTDAPTVVLHTTVGRRPCPTDAPTVVLEATVGRDPFPTVPPTAAWQPCLAQPGSSLSWPVSVFTSAARIALYTAPVRELVILRCVKKREKTNLTTLRRTCWATTVHLHPYRER
jgi:hypothetical protein